MSVDALEHDGPVARRGIEIGGGREALLGPQFLVPAAAEQPRVIWPRGGIVAQPLLQILDGRRADQIQLKRRLAQSHDVPVGVDQPGQQRPPCAIDRVRDSREPHQLGMLYNSADLAVVADRQRAEMLQLAVGADLHAVDVGDQRVGHGRRGEERSGKCEERLVHEPPHSIVWRALKV